MAKGPPKVGFDRDVEKLRAPRRKAPARAGILKTPFVANTVAGGWGNDTLLGIVRGPEFATVYGGTGNDAVFPGGGLAQGATVYGGVSNDMAPSRRGSLVYGAAAGSSARIVTVTVIHPATRKSLSVVFDRGTNSYLDKNLVRWVSAPVWMRNQIR